MRVFLSWSGAHSREIAIHLRQWLPKVLPNIDPWMSEFDIAAGEHWSAALAQALTRSRAAVVVLTSENITAPWVLFEAGALSRRLERTVIMPYLADVMPSQLVAPLAQFQAKSADRAGTLAMVRRLNSLCDRPEPDAVIDRRFASGWPRFANTTQHLRPDVSRVLQSAARLSKNVSLTEFRDAREYDLYIASRIDAAHSEICDFTWKDTIGPTHDLRSRRQSLREYELSIARAAQRIAYREIFIFTDPRRVDKLERRLKEERPGYSCRYFKTEIATIPRIQFVLIDGKEVAFGSHESSSMGAVIQSSELGIIMQSYFDDVWRHAIRIKEGSVIYWSAVEEIRSSTVVAGA